MRWTIDNAENQELFCYHRMGQHSLESQSLDLFDEDSSSKAVRIVDDAAL
jgi:hypothetical protein